MYIMIELKDNLIIAAICFPVILFILGVVFRLLDNSSSIFLNHEILVDSSYVSKELIKTHIENTDDPELKKSLTKALWYRKLHNLFMILMVVSIPPIVIAVLYYF